MKTSPRLPISDRAIAEIRQLKAEGWSYYAISRAVGRSEAVIWDIVNHLGPYRYR